MAVTQTEIVRQDKIMDIPDEIYLEIARNLTEFDRACLASTCRRFKNLETEELNALVKRMHRSERFRLDCYGERQGEPYFQYNKNCSACLTTHNIRSTRCFSDEELQIDGTLRRCRGMSSMVKIHPALSLLWTHLLRDTDPDENAIFWKENEWRLLYAVTLPDRYERRVFEWVETNQDDPDHAWLLKFIPGEFLTSCCYAYHNYALYKEGAGYSSEDAQIKIEYSWLLNLDTLRHTAFLSPGFIQDAIRSWSKDIDICPHISMAHEKVAKAIFLSKNRCQKSGFECKSCHTTGEVSILKDCYVLSLGMYITEPVAKINVKRKLGDMENSPNDRAWLLQLEEKRPVYSDWQVAGLIATHR